MLLDKIMDVYKKSLAHCFLVHGAGVEDCVSPGVMLGAYLRKGLLQGRFDIVLFYDAATGFSFPDDLAAAIHKERIAKGENLPEFVSMKLRAARAVGLVSAEENPRGFRSSPLAKAVAETEPEFPVDTQAALSLIDRLLRSTVKDGDKTRPLRIVVVFEFAHATFPRSSTPIPDFDVRGIFASKWASESAWVNGRSSPIILFVARDRDALHPALTGEGSRVYDIELPAPAYEERLAFVEQILTIHSKVELAEGIDARTLATHTAGLSLLGIEDIVVANLVDRKAITLESVRERKRALMESAYGGVLDTSSPRFGFEAVAGHEEVKAYCKSNIVEGLRSGNVRRVPRGLILSGPPGTGKTKMAEAIAYEAGVNFARLNVQNLMDRFVGGSEKNLRRALDAIRSLVPCLVFVDELDTMFSTRDSADPNQVNKNLLGMILSFLSESSNKGKVVFIAATNRPDRIDPALRRPGRFDKMIPLLPPNTPTRIELLQIVAAGLGCAWDTDVAFESAGQATEGWTQAELEALVQAIFQEADDEGHGETLSQANLEAALSYVQPSTASVDAWSSLAVQMCNDFRLLPEEWRQIAETKTLPAAPAWAEPTARGERDW